MVKLAFNEIRADEYSEAKEARELGEMLIERVEAHVHLQMATVGYVFRDDELRRRGDVVVAEAILVERILQSEKRYARIVKWAILRILGIDDLPTFLVLIDRNIWEGYSIEEKVALVDHELSHCAQATTEDGETPKFTRDGDPVWTIKGHDLEEFCGVVERNGLWSEQLREMARVIVDRLSDDAGLGATVRRIA